MNQYQPLSLILPLMHIIIHDYPTIYHPCLLTKNTYSAFFMLEIIFQTGKPWVYPRLAAMGPQVLNLAHNQLEVRGLEIVVQARSAGSAGGFTRARKP